MVGDPFVLACALQKAEPDICKQFIWEGNQGNSSEQPGSVKQEERDSQLTNSVSPT